jgi:hypothetical protein
MYGTHKLLVYAHDVSIVGKILSIIKNREVIRVYEAGCSRSERR